MKYLKILTLFIASWFCNLAHAYCYFSSGSTSNLTLSIPSPISLPRDIPIGTTIYDSGWQLAGSPIIYCTTADRNTGKQTGNIGGPALGVPGYTDGRVFTTPVPGLGIQIFWCNSQEWTCNTNPNGVTPLPDMNWTTYVGANRLGNSWWVRLIKTGDFDNQYSQAFNITASILFGTIEASNITITTPANLLNISNRTCKVTTPSEFTVRLPYVNKSDFQSIGALNNATANFSLDMVCERNLKVNYMFTALGTGSDVANVINNSTGNNMATGVGIQLFKGGSESTTVVPLDQKQLYTTTGATNDNFVSMPFTAKYYKIKDITPGLINTKTVFTLTYE